MSARASAFFAAVIFVVTEIAGAAAVQTVDALEVARRMAGAGAVDLALERVNQSQPGDPSSPQWLEWELLRIELLGRRGRDAEVSKRVAAMRNLPLSDRAAAQLWLTAARSAERRGDAAEARRSYARYFVFSHALISAYRDARLAVINLYVREGKAEDAYRSMLRFQQDFSPLRTDETERFVAALIAVGRASEAVTWLPQLDKASPSAAMLRLRAGLITPDVALAQARALAAKGGGEPALDLLASAAVAQKNRAAEIEAQEQRLNLPRVEFSEALAQQAMGLWNLYAEVGQQVANQAQLLIGDEAAWIDRALRMNAKQPQYARALLGHVAGASRNEEVRMRAQSQLMASLRDAKLASTALRLFADPRRFPVVQLHPNVRFELGALAADQKHPEEALRFWQNLPQPPGMSAPEWRLRYVAALLAAGMMDAGLEGARSALAGPPALPPELIGRWNKIAADALERWQLTAAESLFAMVLPLAQGPERINALLGLAKARELRGEFRAAADAYFNAAALYASPDADREALRAREWGAVNLAKAGLLDDARATYQWLAANAKDPAIRDSAARALKNL